jgi:hypothetical protein
VPIIPEQFGTGMELMGRGLHTLALRFFISIPIKIILITEPIAKRFTAALVLT